MGSCLSKLRSRSKVKPQDLDEKKQPSNTTANGEKTSNKDDKETTNTVKDNIVKKPVNPTPCMIVSSPKDQKIGSPELKKVDSLLAEKMDDVGNNLNESLNLSPTRSNVPKRKTMRVYNTVKMVKDHDAKGNKMLNNYVFIDDLGQGAYAKVKLAVKRVGNTSEDILNEEEQKQEEQKQQQVTRRKSTVTTLETPNTPQVDQKKYAIKIFKKSFLKRKREYYKDKNGRLKFHDALEDVMREIAVMKKLNHDNIIKLYEVISNQDAEKLYLVLEFAEKGQLIEYDDFAQNFYFCEKKIKDLLSEEYLRKVFRDCIKGLHYLHQNGVIHRDIKPQNILRDSNDVYKLADFGVSVVTEQEDRLGDTKGTYHFMAPEMFDPDKCKSYSGKAADIWALGVTFYCFTFLIVPFDGDDTNEIQEKICNTQLEFPTDQREEISDGLKSFFNKMMDKNDQTRPKLTDLENDPWLNTGCSKTVIDEIKVIDQKLEELDVQNVIELHTVVRLKAWVSKWKGSHDSSQSITSPALAKSQGRKSQFAKINTEEQTESKKEE